MLQGLAPGQPSTESLFQAIARRQQWQAACLGCTLPSRKPPCTPAPARARRCVAARRLAAAAAIRVAPAPAPPWLPLCVRSQAWRGPAWKAERTSTPEFARHTSSSPAHVKPNSTPHSGAHSFNASWTDPHQQAAAPPAGCNIAATMAGLPRGDFPPARQRTLEIVWAVAAPGFGDDRSGDDSGCA